MASENDSVDIDSLDSKVIGTEFVRRYYTMLHENPKELSKFYGKESVFLHADDKDGSSDNAVIGQESIVKKIESLELSDCFAKIKQVDCQSTVADCILIQVSGTFTHTNKPWRPFVQSILLERESPNLYYARNDIFRYQPPNEPEGGDDTIDLEDAEEQEEAESVKDTSENVPTEPASDQTNDDEASTSNEDQLQNSEKPSPAAKRNAADEQKSESLSNQQDSSNQVSDVQEQDDSKADGNNESAKKDAGVRTWAALAGKSPDVPINTEAAPKKVIRKPVENSGKSSRSNQHHKEDGQSQRSNNFRNSSQRDGQQTDYQIFIGGLTPEISEKELRNEFSVFGEVKHIKTNTSKGFGFVSFENEESVKRALTTELKIFVGKTQINIEEKKSSNVRHDNRRGRDGGRHSGFHNRQNRSGGYRSGERGSGRRQDRN
ncbi:uncharacterized protein TRIADDRAFT_64182 [Trichoplax adhaerens]|uniref:Uncharacterized protein n=1 Tax=Trichoplax adhaerens TaxID=10228 RepID=B3S4P9_TRIAD|nr:hypothetical protein TRIADDRAFT_64182 [Trichoplax adhaerens]EDV22122.1 hypothetical protein TRIADDRAFT_64182 [Trichoplax adhaerens]|eukprot:XP_002115277.1 hypothetical protein TRIADDRAFT_64182 [Trichoplax adhaerens]